MAGSDDEQGTRKPSEQRGGTTPDRAEAREKGEWAGTAADGIVARRARRIRRAARDAGRATLSCRAPVLGRTTGSDEPATEAAST